MEKNPCYGAWVSRHGMRLGFEGMVLGFRGKVWCLDFEACYVAGFPGYGAWVSRHGMRLGFEGMVLEIRGMHCTWNSRHGTWWFLGMIPTLALDAHAWTF